MGYKRQEISFAVAEDIFMDILGIDIGGSGIKGAPVNVTTGELTAERYRLDTPQPSTPEQVGITVAELVKHFKWQGPIGCTFPAIVKHGVTWSAANVDQAWIGADAAKLIHGTTKCPVLIMNDADAAGIAEMQFGAGKGRMGTVIMITLGTGIGGAIFTDGHLLPNAELGHVQIRGKDAEHRASARIREEKELSWKDWGKLVNEYLQHIEFLFSPDLFIIGGGVSRKYDKFFPYIELKAEIVPAQLRNDAGIVGAAYAAKDLKA
jgi:polyphosphate glucokinase